MLFFVKPPDFSPPRPSDAVRHGWGLHRGLTKVYTGVVNIFTNRISLDDALARYGEWLATTRRYVARSKREYSDDVSDLVAYLQTRCRLRSPTAVQRQHLEGFLAHCRELGHAPGTRRRSVASIRSFFAFLVADGMLRASPAEHLLPPEREERPPRALTEAEYGGLRRAAADSPRDLAIIETILQTGLRLSEVARLTVNDVALPPIAPRVSLPVGHLRVAGRGHRSRTVTLNIRACEALSAYLAGRAGTDSPALFLTKFGGGIGPRGIEDIVAKRCKAAGIRGASAHTLRHTMAVAMLKRGASVAVVAGALGHARTETMGVYENLARERMDAEMQKAEV